MTSVVAVWSCDHGGVQPEPDPMPDGHVCSVCGGKVQHYVPATEVEALRGWLREFATRIERDRREPDKLLIEVASMRAIADDVRPHPSGGAS